MQRSDVEDTLRPLQSLPFILRPGPGRLRTRPGGGQPRNSAPARVTAPPVNLAQRKVTWPPVNVAWLKSTMPPLNSA